MPTQYFDRYRKFKKNGRIRPVPGIFLSPKDTDKRITYRLGETRMDRLSNDYYGDPFHGFLIMSANPQFGGIEFLIPDGEVIRVPYPFNATVEQYLNEIEKRAKYYGI